MTNEQIVLANRVFLMEEGVISGTGEKFLFCDDRGEREIEVPEEIHTFNEWKNLGYVVKKGEHSIARFPVWKKAKKKKDEDDDYYYMKVAFFFTKGQVEALK